MRENRASWSSLKNVDKKGYLHSLKLLTTVTLIEQKATLQMNYNEIK